MYSGLFHIIRLQADARVTNEVIVNECMEMGVTCAIDARYIGRGISSNGRALA